jgi:hypothetical protein
VVFGTVAARPMALYAPHSASAMCLAVPSLVRYLNLGRCCRVDDADAQPAERISPNSPVPNRWPEARR